MKRCKILFFSTLVTLMGAAFTSGVMAQTTLNPAAWESIQRGQAAADEALATYAEPYPDQPLWQEAIRLGKEAVRQAPGRPEPLRFLADVYTATGWYGPAWQSWNDYLEAGGGLDAAAQRGLVEVGTELGYTAYEAGNPDEALGFYQRVIDLAPEDSEAFVWVGRILTETGRPAQAIPYWQEVLERNPGDERAEYFLELAQDQAEFGVAATNAFREGVERYEAGDLRAASERFARATSLNEDYAEAWAWLGRTAFERGEYRNARSYYGSARELEPDNETYNYFFEESNRRLAGG